MTTILTPAEVAPLYVFTAAHDYVIATSPEDAHAAYCEHLVEDEDAFDWLRLGDDTELTIWCDRDDGSIAAIDDDGAEPVTRTAAEWVERCGRGWLCSTEN